MASPLLVPLPSVPTPARIPAAVFLLQMCQNFQEVKQLHAQLVVSGLFLRRINKGWLVESYVKMSQICYALSVFDSIHSPDLFAYNTMIRGLTLGKCASDALVLYERLLVRGLVPDNYTYTFVLKACSHINAMSEGKQVHCRIIKAGITPNTFVHSSLIHMYASSDRMDCAECVLAEFREENTIAMNSMISGYLSRENVEKGREMFDNLMDKDVASWSIMISGYSKNGMYEKALLLFQEMMVLRVVPNESCLVSVLSICANLGALDQGRWIHTYVDKSGMRTSVTLGTALIDMYAKCGSIECGYEIFRRMSEKDVVTWGVIISGFAIHGQAEKCFQLFDEMIADGVTPNKVAFVAMLFACSHSGYVEMGHHYFNMMVHDFGIRPSIEHYGCMVDLLARAGRLAEAEDLIITMPEQPNSVIWSTLLSACRSYNDPKRGNRAFRRLIELEPMSGDWYKLGGLMYATAGENDNATKIRRFVEENELDTRCGLCFLEVDGTVHEFSSRESAT